MSAKSKKVASALDVFAILMCLGMASLVAVFVGFVLALCGLDAMLVVIVMTLCLGVGAWCGRRMTRPIDALAL